MLFRSNLSTMQDIGGIRVIMQNIEEVENLQKFLRKKKRTDFSF